MEEIKKIFTPEFRNRLDNIIWFDHLSTDVIHQVVDKFIVELQVQLDQKGVSLEVSEEARNWLAEKVTTGQWAHVRWRVSSGTT